MLLARSMRLLLTFLLGNMLAFALVHLVSSLIILTSRRTNIVVSRLSLDQPDLTAIRIDRGTRFGVHKLHLQAHKESDTAIDKEIELELPQQADHTHAHRHGEQSRNSTIISEEVERTIEIHVVKTSLPNNTHDDARTKRKAANFWTNMTISEREQFQQTQVEIFCRRNDLVQSFAEIRRHMLTNRKAKTAFCFAPKVGCTNLKILFFVAQGALPSNQLFKDRDDVNEVRLEEAIRRHSLMEVNNKGLRKVLRNYYKFMMYRNPIERLFSAYRSKVQRHPLVGLNEERPHYNWLRMRIYAYKHPKLYKQWRAIKGVEKIDIKFSEFIDYWLFRDGVKFDEHFQSVYALCQPCQVRYSYYGNFNTFTDDAKVLIQRIGSEGIPLRDGYYKEGEQTSDLAPKYYRNLTSQQKKLIIKKLSLDLSFYYSIFPAERDSHKYIMDTNHDIQNYEY